MKLLGLFNDYYLNFIRIICKYFGDDEYSECQVELERVEKILSSNKYDLKIHFEFQEHVSQKEMNRIFDEDESIINTDELPFLKRCNMAGLFLRMKDVEKKQLWEYLDTLCRYSSMIRACGDKLPDLETVAYDWMENNKGVSPDKLSMKFFQDMLSGGDMSKKLMETFQNPECFSNILENVDIMLRTKGDTNTENNGISGLINALNLGDTDIKDLFNN